MFYILVIDDQQAMCDEIEERFEDEFDNQVTTLKALNGEDGYEKFQSEDDIDLILIDIKNKLTKDSPQYKRAGSKIASNIRSSQKYQTTSPPIKFISGFEEFIEAWETSDSVQNVCDKLDISKQNAYARATKYRSDGVPLQKFVGGGGRAKVSLDEKLAVLAKVRGTSVEELHLESQEMLVSKENEKVSTENQEVSMEV